MGEDAVNTLQCRLFQKLFPITLRYKSNAGTYEGIMHFDEGPMEFHVSSSADFYDILKKTCEL